MVIAHNKNGSIVAYLGYGVGYFHPSTLKALPQETPRPTLSQWTQYSIGSSNSPGSNSRLSRSGSMLSRLMPTFSLQKSPSTNSIGRSISQDSNEFKSVSRSLYGDLALREENPEKDSNNGQSTQEQRRISFGQTQVLEFEKEDSEEDIDFSTMPIWSNFSLTEMSERMIFTIDVAPLSKRLRRKFTGESLGLVLKELHYKLPDDSYVVLVRVEQDKKSLELGLEPVCGKILVSINNKEVLGRSLSLVLQVLR